ncbi:MAG: class I SAM-dependent methyltransferase [Saprospiraceae bacterium]|nr:class I SAM-dependent methyltransferase [Saprospiraceae bacterium]
MRFSLFILIFCCFGLLLACESEKNDRPDTPITQQSSADTNKTTPAVRVDTASEGFFDTYENTNRYIWQKPEMVINLISDLKGDIGDKVIADIGAGKGFFALPLATKAKKVIAIEIAESLTDVLKEKKRLELPEEFQDHLEIRLAEAMDPKLNPGEADVVLIVNTFTYLKDKVKYLRNLKNGLRENGKVIIIGFKKKRIPYGPSASIKVPLYEVEDYLEDAGYTNIQSNDTALDYQYIVIADKK